jgi:hypothetical protein
MPHNQSLVTLADVETQSAQREGEKVALERVWLKPLEEADLCRILAYSAGHPNLMR